MLRRVLRQGVPVARGLLLTLPVLVVLAGLLGAADTVFAEKLGDLLKFFDLTRWPEMFFRIFYVLILAYLLGGIYAHAVRFSADEPTPDPVTAWCKPLLGWVEAVIVLGSVLLLFGAFVIVQFQYFFGGQANINLAGFTYAEYARRGYFELLIVALISLALYLGLNLAAKRQTELRRRIFSGMMSFLMALLLVMLTSALMRLSLYHDAYGFTRLRTYVLISIIWLGLLFLAVIGLEIARRPYRFVQALLAAIFGFAFTLGVVNVDGLIAGQNIQRARAEKELDASYLRRLSADAVPLLVDTYLYPDLPEDIRYVLGRELACRTILLADEPPKSWLSFNIAESRARDLLLANQSHWQGFELGQDRGGWVILEENGETFYCNPWRDWD